MYFIAKYDTKIFPIKKALGKKRLVIVLCSESALENPQNTASLRLKSRLAEKSKKVRARYKTSGSYQPKWVSLPRLDTWHVSSNEYRLTVPLSSKFIKLTVHLLEQQWKANALHITWASNSLYTGWFSVYFESHDEAFKPQWIATQGRAIAHDGCTKVSELFCMSSTALE